MEEKVEKDPTSNVEDIPERGLPHARAVQVQRQDAWGGNVSIMSRSDDPFWQELRVLGDKISDVRLLLDDLPGRVKTLEKLDVHIDPVYSPVFWALVVLILIAVAAIAFWAGQMFALRSL